MKRNILIGLLLLSLQQTGCTNNVQQNKSNEDNRSTEFNIDKVANIDSSYYHLCSEKFESLIKHPDDKHFHELMNEFHYADEYSESLLYCLVASNKLGIDVAKIRVASCLSESLSNPNVGQNSKDLSLSYLKKWASCTKHKRGKQIIERFESLTMNENQIRVPTITYNSSETQRLKAGSLKGSVEDYKKLKEKMSNDEMYVFMLYYAYIMADRYAYSPAKEDVITIVNRFYREHNLGPIDKDTQSFCNLFE